MIDGLGRRHLFVYWKVDPAAVGDAVAALIAVHQALRREIPALEAHVFTRASDHTPATVMESYAMVRPDGVDDTLQQRIDACAAAATAAWRIGPRHEERFDLVA